MAFQIKLIAFNQNLSLQQTFLSMDKFIDGHLKTEIKRLIGMQTLLQEYDRQNKFLNKQVLQLLEENKSLKIDKIKQNIVTQLTDISKYKQKSKVSKQNNYLPNTVWKEQKSSQKIKGLQKQLKDEAIQVTARLKDSALRQLKESSFQKQHSSDAFSFGSPTGRASFGESAIQNYRRNESPNLKKKSMVISPEKIPSTSHKQSFQIDILRSPIQQFQQNQKSKLQQSRELMNLQQLQLQKFIIRSSSCILRGKKRLSNHAIEPSRQIEPTKSYKNLADAEDKAQIQRASSHSFLRGQSGERRKKFITLVSSKQKKIIWEQLASVRNLGC